MKKLLVFIFAVFVCNIYIIFKSTFITIPKIAILPWYKHLSYGVIPTPVNNVFAQYIIYLRSEKLVQDMQGDIYNAGVDSIFYLFVDENVNALKVKELVRNFITYGADINFKYPHSGCTPVRNLLANNMIVEANYLLSLGADLSVSSKVEKKPSNICSFSVDDIYAQFPSVSKNQEQWGQTRLK